MLHYDGFRNMSLFILLLGIALCFTSIYIADVLCERELSTRIEEANVNNRKVARIVEENMRCVFSQADTILQVMKTHIETDGHIHKKYHDKLRSFKNLEIINQIAISDAQGNLVFSAVALSNPINIAKREHFKAQLEDDSKGLYIAAPRISDANGTPSIFLSRRINNASGNFAGVVSVGIDQRYLESIYNDLELGADNSIVLLRKDGSILARAPNDITIDNLIGRFHEHIALNYIRRNVSTGIYETLAKSDNVVRLGAFRALSDYPLVVLVGVSKLSILKNIEARSQVYRNWANAFCVAVVGSLLVIWSQLRKQYKISEELEVSQEYNRKLDRLNLVSQMAAGVAHEIRNPMTVVTGYIQMMSRKANTQSQEQYKLVLEELEVINQIITTFLSLARNKKVEMKRYQLNDILKNHYQLIYTNTVSQGINIIMDLDDSLPEIECDKNELSQLILNLTKNAADAMGEKGTITIKTRSYSNRVELLVSDIGPGISAELMEKVFDPFFTTKDDGTGLGLSVVKSIVDRHNGQINIQSVEGKGTTFIISFPVRQKGD